MKNTMSEFRYLFGKPKATALLRSKISDFKVFEILPYTPCGEGEHLFIHIKKTGANTNFVARELAKYFKVKENLVTYAGLKDRFAITEQWFGVHLPGKKVYDLSDLNIEGVEVLSSKRHNKKLRIGGLLGNRFELILRNVSQIKALTQCWQKIINQGVPNYFGEQRFGIDGGNIPKALALFAGGKVNDKKKRGMYLSAARSYLFNQVVSKRIEQHCFSNLLSGDVCMLKDTQSVFKAAVVTDELSQRLAEQDIDITATMWGAGDLMTEHDALALEQSISDTQPEICQGLAKFGLKQERRKIKLSLTNSDFSIENDTVTLSFCLPAGSYATTVLRELVDYKDMTTRVVAEKPSEKEKSLSKVKKTINVNDKVVNTVEQNTAKMRILLSNDDGVHALGIKVLYQELSKFAEVLVVAPDRNCSGASNSLTLLNPLRAQALDNGFISVNGTPTDCVQLGISQLMQPKPDLVVAGINSGENLGDDVLYSGTVAAATEGRHMGMPAVAVSLLGKNEQNYQTAAVVAAKFIKRLQVHPLANDQIININVPDVELSQLQGFKVTRLGNRHQADTMRKMKDPWQRDIYWYGSLGSKLDAGEGTDFNAVVNNFASITPLTVDMTAYKSITNITQWLNELSL
jgi:5'/3'-nucleotidase SurE